MLTLDKLRVLGIDVDEGIHRCMDNEGFYLRLVELILEDRNFAVLEEALKSGDRKVAFEATHSLKGVVGNLALKQMYETAFVATELLRPAEAKVSDAEMQIRALLKQYAALKRMAE